MRVIAINPTHTLLTYLKALRISYEVVESAADLSEKFNSHNGIFDGVIAPSNPSPKELKDIGTSPFMRLRELPVFAYGHRRATKERFAHVTAKNVTCAYRGNLRDAIENWVTQLSGTA